MFNEKNIKYKQNSNKKMTKTMIINQIKLIKNGKKIKEIKNHNAKSNK